MAGFFFFFFAPPSAVVLFLSLSFLTKRGPLSLAKKKEAESTFQMQTPLPLSLRLSVVPLRGFLFPTGWPVVRDVCPSPTGLYPLCAPKGPEEPVVAL